METIIDIIFLSYAKEEKLKCLTEQALSTLFLSEDPKKIKFKPIVIESNNKLKPFEYTNSLTIYPNKKFGYNKFMNIGIKHSTSKYLCLCNNDLIFHQNWASEILNAFENDESLVSASPICDILQEENYFKINSGLHYGYSTRMQISGWCIFIKREVINQIGLFDENIKFWFSDTDYSKMLQSHSLKHALVSSSIVSHLESKTLDTEATRRKQQLTSDEFLYYDYKWNHRNYLLYLYRRIKTTLSNT